LNIGITHIGNKMSKYKSNKNLTFEKDSKKSYVFIKEGSKDVGMLMWHYKKKIWLFERH